MANREHIEILKNGADAWNAWRRKHNRAPHRILPDLSNANLAGRDLRRCNFSHANLWGAKLQNAQLNQSVLNYAQMRNANLSGADLSNADAKFAILSKARLNGAKLTGADLRGVSLRRASLRGADFSGTILRHASIAEADVTNAVFDRSEVYGASVWNLAGEPRSQKGLILWANDRDAQSPIVTVDDLETAQFLFLLMNNTKIADVIETASRKTVLILGRFTPARKRVLESIKQRLIERNFVPVLFDFAKPGTRDLTETVASLAYMACFIIADLTAARSIPQELSHIVPYLPSVPVIPLVQEHDRLYSMFEHFQRYPWVLPAVKYRDLHHLLEIFDATILKSGFRAAMKARGIPNAILPKSLRMRKQVKVQRL
jgi:uncharacterized protein YjbI with pentapeptide repeats